MKKTVVLLCGILLATSCELNKKEKAEALFADPVMQNEIFDAILADSSRLHNFFERVHREQNIHSTRHHGMMKKMCCAPGMDSVMMNDKPMQGKMMHHLFKKADQDSTFCMQMCDSVMQYKHLKKHLQQRMGREQQKRKVK